MSKLPVRTINTRYRTSRVRTFENETLELVHEAFVSRLEQAIENFDVVHQKRILAYRKTGRVDVKFPICDWNSYTNVHLLVETLKLEPKCED